ncbi:hypothetical protein CLV59_103108 [Chitinophaga dinghuensis]|uniref:Uncharacterized protein n=1 Tax=Chitinophaga dinghuensis TaxID=1539050 RepID=A0A327W1N9_9BACT|nr:hypothetical protein [Chitinophaga dinghuensis]RAJ83149.1 hypothetical protein CLV59_103108 [Chitinophaga dinghuensis]
MFIDYQKLVLEDYEQKKAKNALSHHLVHPTAAKIREECIAVCTERFRVKDENLLRNFLGKQESPTDYIRAFKKETDKFKPLVNFLKRQITNTDEKNIELLAWLIDFEPRPFQFGKRYETNTQHTIISKALPGSLIPQQDSENSDNSSPTNPHLTEKEDESEVIAEKEHTKVLITEEIPAIPEKKMLESKEPPTVERPILLLPPGKPQRISYSKIIMSIALIILLISLGVWVLPRKTPIMALTGKEGCMFWAGDHYEPISCNQKLGDTLVIALDTFKLNHFKKITRPDTITGYSKGNVWYVKVDNGMEFYTADGYHPIEQWKRLKPITDYIIIKWIRN